jgi:uncharacterized protein (DUF697 family)
MRLIDRTDLSTAKMLSGLVQGLEWLYGRAVNGVPALDSAGDLAARYQRRFPATDDAVDALIKWQMAKAGTAGFVGNLGGIVTLPVSLPANLASVTYIQLRMIAAIARMRGHDIESDAVRTIALACLCGSRVSDLVKDFGIRLGTQVAHELVTRLSGDSLRQLNTTIACRIFAVTGATAPINLSKLAPVVGGVIAGGFDAALTRSYGKTAKRLFLPVPTTAP